METGNWICLYIDDWRVPDVGCTDCVKTGCGEHGDDDGGESCLCFRKKSKPPRNPISVSYILLITQQHLTEAIFPCSELLLQLFWLLMLFSLLVLNVLLLVNIMVVEVMLLVRLL